MRNLTKPMDIIMLAGINNIKDHHPAELVIEEMRCFKEEILAMSPWSSVAFATMPLPPSITNLPDDNHTPRHDATDEMMEVNEWILQENLKPQSMEVWRVPKFHTWGLKSIKKSQTIGPRWKMERMRQHRRSAWREEVMSSQLHLNDHCRLKMGRAIVRYFGLINGLNLVYTQGEGWKECKEN
jgi:hypothetical protein